MGVVDAKRLIPALPEVDHPPRQSTSGVQNRRILREVLEEHRQRGLELAEINVIFHRIVTPEDLAGFDFSLDDAVLEAHHASGRRPSSTSGSGRRRRPSSIPCTFHVTPACSPLSQRRMYCNGSVTN